NRERQVFKRGKKFLLDAQQNIAEQKRSPSSKALWLDFENDQAKSPAAASGLRNERRMQRDAEAAIAWGCRKEITHCVAGNRQRQTARDHGVNADDAAARVGQWPSGVSRSQAHFGLYPGMRAQTANGSNSVNHPGNQRANKAHKIANGNREFAGAQLRGICSGGCVEISGVDAKLREIAQ